MKTYTVKDVAKRLEVSEETVRRWIRNGKLIAKRNSTKVGFKISEQDLNDFVKGTKYEERLEIMECYDSEALALNRNIIEESLIMAVLSTITEDAMKKIKEYIVKKLRED